MSRRACPACSRRYAGLVAEDCPVCDGLGLLSLGRAALSRHTPAAVARAVELYLEAAVQRAARDLPYADRRAALEAAVTELRSAGVLSTIADTGPPSRPDQPHDSTAPTVAERDAYTITGTLGVTITTAVLNALHARPIELEDARPAALVIPIASANGYRDLTARTADPIDPLGPDLLELDNTRRTTEHAARVLSAASDDLTRRPRKARR